MDWASKNALRDELVVMQEFGTRWNILFINLEGSSNRLLVGIDGGEFFLDFVREGWLGWWRQRKFVAFCQSYEFPFGFETWGKERIVRAKIGTSIERSLTIIEDCFEEVFRLKGQFKLKLLQVGLSLPDNKNQ